MARFADPEILKRVSEAESKLIGRWAEGLTLENRSGKTLLELRHRAAADRVDLAVRFLRRAEALESGEPPQYRDAISRYYYAAYHAFRAAAYHEHGGDDHQEHSALPSHLPDGIPNQDQWRNDLKDARLTRNRADYEVFPKSDTAWQDDCMRVADIARRSIPVVRSFLRAEGCQYV